MKAKDVEARLRCIEMGRMAFYLKHRNEDATWLDEHFREQWCRMWPEDAEVFEVILVARKVRTP